MKLDPRLRKIIRIALIGTGALAIMSGVVNIIAAWQLIDQAEAQSLGVSRNEFLYTYAGFVLAGGALVYLGTRRFQ